MLHDVIIKKTCFLKPVSVSTQFLSIRDRQRQRQYFMYTQIISNNNLVTSNNILIVSNNNLFISNNILIF